jgi:hypothetical protein
VPEPSDLWVYCVTELTGAEKPESVWRSWRAPRRDGETTFDSLVMVAVQQSMPAVGD